MKHDITKTTLTTSEWIQKHEQKLLSPYLPEFQELVLQPLKARADVGAPTDRLANDLYIELHPWLTRFIARKSRNLPATADIGEIESRVHEAALLACRSLDWNRIETFGPLLRMRVEGAVVEAARHDDWLSRRHRKLLNSFKAEIDDREQKLGRALDEKEKREIARELSPEGARFNWESDLQRQFAPTGWTEVHDNIVKDPHASPEGACMDKEYTEIIHQWLDSLPDGVGEAAYEWAMTHVDGNRGAPRPIMRKLKRYVPQLLEQLGSHMGDESATLDIE